MADPAPTPPAPAPRAAGLVPRTTSGCPKDLALSAQAYDTDPGWKCPSSTKGACSTGDIDQLQANFKAPASQTWFDLAKDLGAACKACAFSKDTDATWQAIVGSAADNGQSGFINFGACFGWLEGDKCGRAYQYQQYCYANVCGPCTSTAAERRQCITSADTRPCRGFVEDTAKSCPKLQDTAKQCTNAFDVVRALCGT